MADSIKKFFKKKKADARFKNAGPGYRLTDSSGPSAPQKTHKDAYVPLVRSGLTDESRTAASAALARLQGNKYDSSTFNKSLAAVRAQAKKELEAEKNAQPSLETSANTSNKSTLAVAGVYFRCPVVGQELLPLDEWFPKIRQFLNEQMASDPGLAAILKLYSLNRNKEKVEQCVEILTKYFGNILENPTEEKYRKIRKTNKIYVEKVAPMEGAAEILEAAGFILENEFYTYPDAKLSEDGTGNLEMLMDALKSAEPILPELDRNLQVLLPSQARNRQELPRQFFRITPEELKQEQKARAETLEKASVLMTKALREKEELRELRNYKYCLIRIRFPDGILIQGTFGVYEPFSAVGLFISECLIKQDMAFELSSSFGEKFTKDEEKNLLELKLVPASVLIFVPVKPEERYLLPEVEILMQQLEV